MTVLVMSAAEWDEWLAAHAATASEAWLRIPKKGSADAGLSAAEAGDVALCHGWIDSHRRRLDERAFLQRYSPRRPGSPWSRVNVVRVEALEAAGRLRPGGRAELAAARADGRWSSAYEPQRTASTPPDLAEVLSADAAAGVAYAALTRSEQYALFLPLLKARTAASRARALTRALAALTRTPHHA
ncbi:YdeI/OmpD-associated family protein [Dactylosporangium sp. AC04546]|uniref:YdeI/OmpD-associated family protein n=1 Tax=Dactylosporangium sp. AC04546 TaxID=2862460 RepID=UPI001EE0D91A|nr:YdeI/OmpD-associated family protein [Dactylosporangium sp. AC04546]WVK85712.1 YdeI/OmpD-associated family protein [Dactylosporangium sp. AC04546]